MTGPPTALERATLVVLEEGFWMGSITAGQCRVLVRFALEAAVDPLAFVMAGSDGVEVDDGNLPGYRAEARCALGLLPSTP